MWSSHVSQISGRWRKDPLRVSNREVSPCSSETNDGAKVGTVSCRVGRSVRSDCKRRAGHSDQPIDLLVWLHLCVAVHQKSIQAFPYICCKPAVSYTWEFSTPSVETCQFRTQPSGWSYQRAYGGWNECKQQVAKRSRVSEEERRVLALWSYNSPTRTIRWRSWDQTWNSALQPVVDLSCRRRSSFQVDGALLILGQIKKSCGLAIEIQNVVHWKIPWWFR